MFKRVSIFSLVLLMAASQAGSLTTDDGRKLALGSIAGLVCILSAPKAVSQFNRIDKDAKVSTNLYHAFLAAGMSYTISKLAPYARKSLQLKSSDLLVNPKKVSEPRYLSLIKATLSGAVAGVSAVEMVNIINGQQMKNNNYVNRQTGNVCNLAYAAYNSGYYSYSKLKTVFQ